MWFRVCRGYGLAARHRQPASGVGGYNVGVMDMLEFELGILLP